LNKQAAGVDGQEVTVKYKDGEKKIIIGKDVVIRAYAAGDKSELKPGAHIAIVRADKMPDGGAGKRLQTIQPTIIAPAGWRCSPRSAAPHLW
jgi:hypothetical protein